MTGDDGIQVDLALAVYLVKGFQALNFQVGQFQMQFFHAFLLFVGNSRTTCPSFQLPI